MVGPAIGGMLGALLLGAAGGFAGERSRKTQEKQTRDFNAFMRVAQGAAAAGESGFFTDENLKSFKKLGGDETVFGALGQLAGAELTQEARNALLQGFIESGAKSRAGTARAGVAENVFRGVASVGGGRAAGQRLPPAGVVGAAVGPGAAQAETAVRGAGVAERRVTTEEAGVGIARREVVVKEAGVGISRERLQLDRDIAAGKADALTRQLDLVQREIGVKEDQIRGLLTADIQQSGIAPGDSQVLAKSFLTGEPIKNERLAKLVPQARASLSEVTAAKQGLNASFKSRKGLLNTVAKKVRGKLTAPEIASTLDQHNALVLQEIQTRQTIGEIRTQQEAIDYVFNNMVFRAPDGSLVNLRVAEQKGIDFSQLSPSVPQGIASTRGPSPAATGFLREAQGP